MAPLPGKNLARVLSGHLPSFIALGGREAAFDLVLTRLNWLMVALEVKPNTLAVVFHCFCALPVCLSAKRGSCVFDCMPLAVQRT
jgi:hypothetical protein